MADPETAGLAALTGTCGAELMPLALMPDGLPSPVICTLEPHGPRAWHAHEETGTRWPSWAGDVTEIRASFAKAIADPRELRRNQRLNLRRNLSRRARWRLRWQHQANAVLIWLCRTPEGAAIARKLWRL